MFEVLKFYGFGSLRVEGSGLVGNQEPLVHVRNPGGLQVSVGVWGSGFKKSNKKRHPPPPPPPPPRFCRA